MRVAFPAPWLWGASSAGEAFSDAFQAARLMQLKKRQLASQEQLGKEELAIRKETLAETKRQHAEKMRLDEMKEALEIGKMMYNASPEAFAKYMQTPEMTKMFPTLGALAKQPWTAPDEMMQKVQQVQQTLGVLESMGVPVTPAIAGAIGAKIVGGVSLGAKFFEGAGGGGGGGRGGRGGGGGEAGALLFVDYDSEGRPVIWNGATGEYEAYDPRNPAHHKAKRGQVVHPPFPKEGAAPKLNEGMIKRLEAVNTSGDPQAAKQLDELLKAQGMPGLKPAAPLAKPTWLGFGTPTQKPQWTLTPQQAHPQGVPRPQLQQQQRQQRRVIHEEELDLGGR